MTPLINLRVTEEQRDQLKARAKQEDKSLSAYLRDRGLEDTDVWGGGKRLETPEKRQEAAERFMQELENLHASHAPSELQKTYECPRGECDFSAKSPKATCPVHGLRVR